MEKTAFLAIFRPFKNALTKSFVATKRNWKWKNQYVKSCTVNRGKKWHQNFFSIPKIVGGDTLWNWGKNQKKSFLAHKNENISKSSGPILKNSTPIVFFLNFAYNAKFLKKSVQNWRKRFYFEVPPLTAPKRQRQKVAPPSL